MTQNRKVVNCDIFCVNPGELELWEDICITGNFYADTNIVLLRTLETGGDIFINANEVEVSELLAFGDIHLNTGKLCTSRIISEGNSEIVIEPFLYEEDDDY